VIAMMNKRERARVCVKRQRDCTVEGENEKIQKNQKKTTDNSLTRPGGGPGDRKKNENLKNLRAHKIKLKKNEFRRR
jgi:hypothetical protein